MKYLKTFENKSSHSNEEISEMAMELMTNSLKDNPATEEELISSLPFRISSDELWFHVERCEVKDEEGEKSLYVYVNKGIDGSVTNPYSHKFSNEQALCMVMTAWIHWEILNNNLPTHVNVKVYLD